LGHPTKSVMNGNSMSEIAAKTARSTALSLIRPEPEPEPARPQAPDRSLTFALMPLRRWSHLRPPIPSLPRTRSHPWRAPFLADIPAIGTLSGDRCPRARSHIGRRREEASIILAQPHDTRTCSIAHCPTPPHPTAQVPVNPTRTSDSSATAGDPFQSRATVRPPLAAPIPATRAHHPTLYFWPRPVATSTISPVTLFPPHLAENILPGDPPSRLECAMSSEQPFITSVMPFPHRSNSSIHQFPDPTPTHIM
jgi:hypothetical protein